MATLEEVIDSVRSGFLHDEGGSGVDWRLDDTLCRHSNTELTNYANLAMAEVAKRVNNSWSTVEQQIQPVTTTVPNGNVVTLPQRRLDRVHTYLVRLNTDGERIGEPVQIDDLYKENSDWSLAKLYPKEIAWTIIGDQAEVIGMATDTLYLFMQTWQVYPAPLVWGVDNATEFGIDESYVQGLYFYMCYLAFMKDDPDVLDVGRSEEFLSKFTREIGRGDNMYAKRRRNQRDRRPIRDYW